MTPVSDCLKAT